VENQRLNAYSLGLLFFQIQVIEFKELRAFFKYNKADVQQYTCYMRQDLCKLSTETVSVLLE